MHTTTGTDNAAPRNQITQNVARTEMTSREIAELTGKQHKDVIRDVRVMLQALAEDGANLRHVREDKDGRGYTTNFHLDRELTETLVTGYSIPLRHRVIRRLHELEERAAAAPAIPQTLPDALRLAADLAEQNTNLRLVVDAQAPKVDALERLTEACGTLCLTDTAKHLNIPRKRLLAWMRENRWIYRRDGSAHWLAYQPRMASGHLEHRVTVIGEDHIGDQRLASRVRVTPKGLAKLAEKIAEGVL